ncbi:hypothetical protein V5G24_23015 [Xanthobacter sp. VTT E-85241]|uniref:hypothetical protein n=1 Tax=Roseixanthobacter finlandensis TaxID=3119922 RepID=UPI00372BB067
MTSSKSKTQTTTSTVAPPGWIGDQQQFALDQARSLYDQGAPAFYPGQTYADLSPETSQAMGLATDRAVNGSPAVRDAQGNVTDTLNGAYLNANPYLNDAIDIANQGTVRGYQDSIFPTIASGSARSGRYGSGLYADAQDSARTALAGQLSDTSTTMANQNYMQERQNQLAAAGLAPALANQDYTDISALGQVGAQKEAQAQKGIDESMARYSYDANSQGDALNQFLQRLGLVTPGAGTTSTNTQPVQGSNALGQVLGLAATGAGYYFGGPSGGAAAGGAANSLFGGGGGGYSQQMSSPGGVSYFGSGPVYWNQ